MISNLRLLPYKVSDIYNLLSPGIRKICKEHNCYEAKLHNYIDMDIPIISGNNRYIEIDLEKLEAFYEEDQYIELDRYIKELCQIVITGNDDE